MSQSQQTNIPSNVRVENQPRPKPSKDLIKAKIAEKEKLCSDKKVVNK